MGSLTGLQDYTSLTVPLSPLTTLVCSYTVKAPDRLVSFILIQSYCSAISFVESLRRLSLSSLSDYRLLFFLPWSIEELFSSKRSLAPDICNTDIGQPKLFRIKAWQGSIALVKTTLIKVSSITVTYRTRSVTSCIRLWAHSALLLP